MALPRPQRDSQDANEDFDGGRMTFLEHLDELRTRLIQSCIALVCGMGLSLLFVKRAANVVLSSMLASLPSGSSLILTKPGEGFSFYLDLALMGGVILTAPFITYQAWRFIAPGLYTREKRLIIPFLAFAVSGAVGGAVFSHRVLFPSLMAFFSSFDSPLMRFTPRVEDTFTLYRNTLVGMVIVFQIPTLVFVLARMRVITARWLLCHTKHALLAAAVAGAVLTPSSDPWNQIVFAAPILVMYVMGIGIAWAVYPRGEDAAHDRDSTVGLVIAAGVLEEANRRRVRGLRLVHSRRD
jgi:sec-independent protein translocase protein TatC